MHKSFLTPWRPALSQIYRALSEMTAEGLVEFDTVYKEKQPYQNMFRITEAGHAELQKWFKEPQPHRVPRLRMLGQMWFGSETDTRNMINNLEAFAEQVREQLKYYELETIPNIKKHARGGGTNLEEMYHNLVASYIVRECKLLLEWSEDAIHRLRDSAPTMPSPVVTDVEVQKQSEHSL